MEMMKNQLEIVIPTYNRAEILKRNLNAIESEVIKYNVRLLISDDSDNDDVLQVVNNSCVREHITFIKNKPSLGHDANCVSALSKSQSEYVWYLGDSLELKTGAISKIIEFIQCNEVDLLILRRSNKNLKKIDVRLFDKEKIDIIWHLTLSGASIYRNQIMKKYLPYAINNKNFPQAYISCKVLEASNNIYYLGSVTLLPSSLKKQSYWKSNLLEVFGYDWSSLINSLSGLSRSEKKRVKRSHSKNTGIFGLRKIFEYHCDRSLTLKSVYQNKSIVAEVSHINIAIIFLVLMFPRVLIRAILKIKGVVV
ncbi:glycosyltransferase family 2 protein [Vibrio campbellii]|uniref:glycosyltransferase family 2 protein n=1 Tax=Vibrio campbellii TaxID=680 RepID=UPI0040573C35